MELSSCPDCHEMAEDLRKLRGKHDHVMTVLKELADGWCCQTPGCSPDDPMCDAMIAKAGVREVS